MKKLLLCLICLLMASLARAQERTVLQDEASQAAWQEDLDFMMEKITTEHPNPYFRFSEAEFDAKVDALSTEIPYLTDDQIVLGMAEIAAMLDGHSYIFLLQQQTSFRMYQLRLYVFEEGIYATDADDESIIGQRLISVGDVPAEEIYQIASGYSGRDNEHSLRFFTPHIMVIPEVLHGAGITSDMEQPAFIFEDESGTQISYNPPIISFDRYLAWADDNGHASFIGLPSDPESLYLSNMGESFWWTYLEDSGTVYMQYNVTFSTTPSGETLRNIATGMIEQAEKPETERVVIDVRFNGGGDNTTYATFRSMLCNSEAINQPGKFFVIIGRATFSAAKDFVLDLAKQCTFTLVGEPTGGGPNNHGESRHFSMPNSDITVTIATHYVEKGGPDDTRDAIAPDIPVPVTAADYFAGQDGALEAILAQ
jgi:hypothetical protein